MCRMVLDKAPPPVPRRGRPIVCVYVDNVSILGVDLPSVLAFWRSVCEILEGSGLHLHGYVSPLGALELVGLLFVPNSFWIQHKPARLWKLRRASAALVRLGVVFACQIMCWLRHAVHLAMLFRPIRVFLLDVYRCLHDATPTDRIEITKAAQREIRFFADLCLLCTANSRCRGVRRGLLFRCHADGLCSACRLSQGLPAGCGRGLVRTVEVLARI